MAYTRLSMRKTREILRLHHSAALSNRAIARSLKLSASTVSECLARARAAAVRWPLPGTMTDTALEQALYPPPPERSVPRPLPAWATVHQELKRKGVTLMLLWEEYKAAHPNGVMYSAFCDHYRAWCGQLDVVMRQDHRAGDKLFIDYAGQTVPIVNRDTGEINQAQIFVAVLGASNYTYAEATLTQTLPDWIGAHTRAFAFLGGVPNVLVPDNLKAAVTTAHRYEPDLNPTYQDMANHYGVAVVPTRVRKPRDKAKVEVAVQIVERTILAVLRHRSFFSLAELNAAIRELLHTLNTRAFKKLSGSRRSLFESVDKPALNPLPSTRYEYAEWKKVRVHIDYHVEFQRHYYAVPHALIRKQLDLRITATTLTKASASPLITALRYPDATPPCPSTCPRNIAAMATGRPSVSNAGPPLSARPPRSSSPTAYASDDIPSRLIGLAWAFCVWPKPTATTASRPPAHAHCCWVPRTTKVSPPSSAMDSTNNRPQRNTN